jgi:surface polysaccharide O-acyltransferase-like enzyme
MSARVLGMFMCCKVSRCLTITAEKLVNSLLMKKIQTKSMFNLKRYCIHIIQNSSDLHKHFPQFSQLKLLFFLYFRRIGL